MKSKAATGNTQQELFDPKSELDRVRDTIRCGQRRARKSALDPYRCELLDLKAVGATLGEMVAWLRRQTGREFERSTVLRYLERRLGGGRG